MRVYEWGPEDGEKILFVHGISTSCMTVSVLAQAMADRGHRVMIFVSCPPPLKIALKEINTHPPRTSSAAALPTASVTSLMMPAFTSPRSSSPSPPLLSPGQAL